MNEGKYKAYPEYKDSGVDWLGDIPSHWHSTKIKFGYQITLGKMLQKEPRSGSDELKPYLKASNIQPEGLSIENIDQMWFSPDELRKLRLKKKDILITEGGDVGRASIWNDEISECYIQNAVNRGRPLHNNSSRYLYYWISMLKDSEYINIICNKATIAHYTAEKVEESPLLMPRFNDANVIANFLDHETAKIDTLIEKQKQLIKLLKEKRQAVISHAVTKGLNPDAPMRDSGVEWLEEVPEHWIVSRIGFFTTKIGSGKTPKGGAEVYTDEGVIFLRSQNVYNDGLSIITGESVYITNSIHEEMSNSKVLPNDILLNITGGSIGRTCLVPENFQEANVNQHVCILRIPKEYREYISYVMKSDMINIQLNLFQTGGNREGLNFEQISKMILCIPSNNERNEIVKFLKESNSKYDLLEIKTLKAIKLLQERRTALISAAVTGKIDVRDWKAPTNSSEARLVNSP